MPNPYDGTYYKEMIERTRGGPHPGKGGLEQPKVFDWPRIPGSFEPALGALSRQGLDDIGIPDQTQPKAETPVG